MTEKIDLVKVRKVLSDYNELHDKISSLHDGGNCFCDGEADTFTISHEGAGDMDICLECFGARGLVY